MSAVSTSPFICTDYTSISSSSTICKISTSYPLIFCKLRPCPGPLSSTRTRKRRSLIFSKSSEGAELSATKDEWLKKLPEKNKPLYAHSLPCVEAWLISLGFYQSKDDRALWFVEKPDWRAQLSLDATELFIRYLKTGPGNLEKDIERRFSYALSREDIENAILGGP